jgi:two-component system, sensor histidine kinase YesM
MKMLRLLRNKQLHIKVFVVYTVILGALTAIVALPINWYSKENLKQTLNQETNSTAENIMTQLDSFYDQYNQISKYFYLDKDHLGLSPVEYFDKYKKAPNDQYYTTYNALINNLALSTELYHTVNRISLYTDDSIFLSSKSRPSNLIKKPPSIEEIRRKRGGVFIDFSIRDHWNSKKELPVFVFTRQLRMSNREIGFLEVQFNGETLTNTSIMPGATLMVLHGDENTTPIYQSGREFNEEQMNYVQEIAGSGYSKLTKNKSGYIFHYIKSEKSNLHLIYSIAEQQFYSPVTQLNYLMIFIVILIISLAATIFFITAKWLTNPLRNLISIIDNISLEEEPFKIENKHHINEIDSLNQSFQVMNSRLQNSLSKIVQFHTSESQLRLKLLQAQINPHFIFNMIGVITILAKRGKNDEVEIVSRQLANFLRYTTSFDSRQTQLINEMEFTQTYLELMKTRYKDRMMFKVDLPNELKNIPIPKLLIQPIVENCIKHGFINNRELQINIYGEIDRNWRVIVEDNGSGFSPEAMKKLKIQMEEYKRDPSKNYDLSIGGMGIISTFIRLHLFYSENVIFEFGNNESGGAYIVIGGNLSPDLSMK